jgi:uncharacterized protein YqeY
VIGDKNLAMALACLARLLIFTFRRRLTTQSVSVVRTNHQSPLTVSTVPGVPGDDGAPGVTPPGFYILDSDLSSHMTLQEKIDSDLKEAMRAKEAERLSVLRMVKSAMMNAVIEKHGAGGRLTDADAIVVLRKQVKQRQDSVAGFEKGGRLELAEKERREIGILSSYLPQPLTTEEVASIVQAAIAETGASSKAQMGQVMKLVNEKTAGRADGRTLSEAVQKALS